MSTYHFTSTELYRKRVIQMGEQPNRVFNVGAPGLDNIKQLKYMSKREFEKKFNFKLREKNLLITYHPVTASSEDGIKDLLSSLSAFSDFGQIITLPNSDPGHDPIIEAFQKYSKNRDNVFLIKTMGQIGYISAMKLCDVVIGNSSSGIIEAPFLGKPTVNIGVRQKGRLLSSTILCVPPSSFAITKAIKLAFGLKKIQSKLYGKGDSSKKIVKKLASVKLSGKIGFYDIKFNI